MLLRGGRLSRRADVRDGVGDGRGDAVCEVVGMDGGIVRSPSCLQRLR